MEFALAIVITTKVIAIVLIPIVTMSRLLLNALVQKSQEGFLQMVNEWRRVGVTEYRKAEPADIMGARVSNADYDAIYLVDDLYGRKFVAYLGSYDTLINEYREATNEI